MKLRKIFALLFMFQGIMAMAQCQWLDTDFRKQNFPEDDFYVSYHYLLVEGNLNDCIARTVSEAQSQLAKSISSKVSVATRSASGYESNNGVATETEIFQNDFTSQSSAQLVNVKTEHYYDESSKLVHALAYVKKQDLSDFCESKLNTTISLLTGKLKQAEEFISTGYKREAADVLKGADSEIAAYPAYLSQLITIGKSSTPPSYFTSALEELTGRLAKYQSDLQKAMTVYFEAAYQPSLVTNEILSGKCKGILSNNGFSFVANPEDADFVVNMDYSTRTSSQSEVGWFAFADVNLTITRNRDKCVLYQDLLSVKGGGGDEDKAHRKAIEQSSKKICDIIISNTK